MAPLRFRLNKRLHIGNRSWHTAVWVFFAVFSVAGLVRAQNQQDPTLASRATLKYPPLARQARIQGQVHLEFFVNHHGDVVAVNVLSGHPILAPGATENVRSWKFALPTNAPLDDQRYETIFDFEISEEDLDLPLYGNALVSGESFRHVRVLTNSPMIGGGDSRRSGCPSEEEKKPPKSQKPDDFVEMSRSGCLGTCPVYTVRIHANGTVNWDGSNYVTVRKKESSDIGSSLARDLISKFSSSDFWQLCTSYSDSVTDSATVTFRVRVGGRTKTLSNYANSAPRWVDDLEYAVDESADTHHWLHGDPYDESLRHIGGDGWGPKPGLTPLMRAAAQADIEKVKTLLMEGADPEQLDSSGWTALMYASPEYCGEGSCTNNPEILAQLIAAGANPNYSSPHGDTPLMAAAFANRFEEALVHAGAHVNAQNTDGVSVLMILASFGKADEIKKALQSGADAKLKDTQGRTALDYLRLANCGQPLLRDSTGERISENSKCNQLDDEDFRKSKRLLQAATPVSVQ